MRKLLLTALLLGFLGSGCVTKPLVDLSGLNLDFSKKSSEKKEKQREKEHTRDTEK